MSLLTRTNFSRTELYSSIRDSVKELKRINFNQEPNLKFSYHSRTKRNFLNYNANDYDLKEAYRIVDTEGFVSAAFTKKINLILKEGYKFESENSEDVEYVKRRLNEIAYVTDKPFRKLLEEITHSVIHNHNAFIHLYRDKKSSTGAIRKVDGKLTAPIAGLMFLPETDVTLIRDKHNRVVGYQYYVNHNLFNIFEKNEVVHLAINKKPTISLGTPPLESVKDDILSLREIEISLEDLIYKLTIPLIHFKVGKDGTPPLRDMETGLTEVQIVQNQVDMMKDAASLVTTDRVSIEMLGAENHALRLTPALDYYKNRVLVGLSISDVDLGTGTTTTGGAAAMIGNALKQNIQMYQTAIENFITDYIITPILLEKDSYKDKQYLNDDEKVQFLFKQSDLDLRIKEESHLINELHAKVITPNEYRIATGRRPLTPEEVNMLNETGEASKSTYNTQNSTNPVNQHTNSSIKVKDDLNIESYINYLYNNNTELADYTLSNNIHALLSSFSDIDIEDCINFVKPLTTSLTTHIIDDIPTDSVKIAVEKVLYKNIIDYIKGE